MSTVASVNAVLTRLRVAGPVQQFLHQSGMHLNVSVYLLMIGCWGVGAFWITLILSRFVLLAAVFGILGGLVPYLFVRYKRGKRLRRFEEQFPEAIDLVARALRAGHALPTGLGMVADELAAPVGIEFRILFDQQNFGLTLPDALRNFAKRIPAIDARFFVTAVLTQREAGGNLAEVLDNLGAVIRERFKVKRQVQVLSAHGRITGWVLGMLPPALAVATFIINPHHLGSLAERSARPADADGRDRSTDSGRAGYPQARGHRVPGPADHDSGDLPHHLRRVWRRRSDYRCRRRASASRRDPRTSPADEDGERAHDGRRARTGGTHARGVEVRQATDGPGAQIAQGTGHLAAPIPEGGLLHAHAGRHSTP